MKILIAGSGRIGSQIAFLSMIRMKPEKIILSDVKDLTGDVLDLQNAGKGLGIKTEITTEKEPCDFIVLSAGMPRGPKLRSHDDLIAYNVPIIEDVVKGLEGCLKADSKIIVMTNPVEKMTEVVQKLLPGHTVTNPERILSDIRGSKELGWSIVSTKGYSNFGPAVSAVLLMEELSQ
jgi:malate/lactate dehydrogenase